MNRRLVRIVLNCVCITAFGISGARGAEAPSGPLDPAPTLKDYEALAKQPDLSGTWTPDIPDQVRQETQNMPPWTP
jgi:hypothetical protein